MPIVKALLSAGATVSVLAACGAGASGVYDGDCTRKARYAGTLYRAVSVTATPRAGPELGRAAYADCEGEPVAGSGEPHLFAAGDLDPARVVLSREGGGDVVYVDQGLARAQWPELLKAATRFPTCDTPAAFTGTWDVIDPADMPDAEDYDVTPPYTGTFSADHGDGLHLDRWSRVTLQARITEATDPSPEPPFIQQALAENRRVRVTTECRDTEFVVTTIRFAG